MPSIQRITVQSDISQVADRFDLPKAGVDGFLTAARNQPVEISIGYKGETLHQLRGEADEWELRWDDKSVTGTKRGRDLGARLVDRPFRKTYFKVQPNPVPTTPYAVGAFTASQIAGEIAAFVGLSLDWSAPDYYLQDDTIAFTSSAGEAIRRLVQTMGQPEMFAIDVYLVGTTLTVKQRVAAPTADYVLSLADLMGTTITYKKRPGPIYGTVRITGGDPLGGATVIQERPPEEIEITEVNETPPVWPLKGRLRTTTTKRVLQSVANEVLLRETSVTEAEQNGPMEGGFERISETSKTIEYDESLLIDLQTGQINLPVKLKEMTSTSGLDETGNWQEIRREGTSYGYDDDLSLILQDTQLEEDVSDSFTPTQRTVIRNQRLDANQYQVTTQIFEIAYTKNKATGKLELDPGLQLVATDVKVTRGQLPGPQHVRRPRRDAGGPSSTRAFKEVIVSNDVDAVDVHVSDNNLTNDLVDALIAQFTAASGLWRHEVTIRHLALPFLTAGKALGWSETLSGLTAPLPTALIVSRTLDYDESGASPSLQATVTLVWWA